MLVSILKFNKKIKIICFGGHFFCKKSEISGKNRAGGGKSAAGKHILRFERNLSKKFAPKNKTKKWLHF